ncbi:MAG: outer membrane lipoprotein-sorting protein [bacterium]
MKKCSKIIFTTLFWVIIFQTTLVCSDINPHEIVVKADEARGSFRGVEWRIKIESIEEGRIQNNTLMITAHNFRCLTEFIAPPKVKGRKLLMIDRNMWFIQPGLRKPVPISPRQKLLGGASNGDIASTNYSEDYEATFISEEKVNGEVCYLFDLVATNKKATYDRIKYWISKDRLVGLKSEFFTVSGKLFKSAVMEYENSINDNGTTYPFISKMVITDAVVKDNITTMIYSKIKLKKIPDSTFDLNLLVR